MCCFRFGVCLGGVQRRFLSGCYQKSISVWVACRSAGGLGAPRVGLGVSPRPCGGRLSVPWKPWGRTGCGGRNGGCGLRRTMGRWLWIWGVWIGIAGWWLCWILRRIPTVQVRTSTRALTLFYIVEACFLAIGGSVCQWASLIREFWCRVVCV